MVKINFSATSIQSPQKFAQFITKICDEVACEQQFNLTQKSFELRFEQLIKAFNQPVVILIDEYDKPLLDNLNSQQLPSIKNTMGTFYATIKSLSAHLRFVFITGVSRFSKISVFSAMNNLFDISMDNHYATLCGITQAEFETSFADDIEQLSTKLQLAPTQLKHKIKHWYNGYCFHHSAPTLYNPVSLLSLFKTKEFRPFWFDTGTPTFLIEQIKNNNYDLTQVTEISANDSVLLSVEPERIKPTALLLQTGYITIKSFKDGWYQFKYPNFEVESCFKRSILEEFTSIQDEQTSSYVHDIVAALKVGQISEVINRLKQFFAQIPYDIQIKQEHYYQTIFHTILTFIGFEIESEIRTNNGRIDSVVKTEQFTYIIEFKLNHSAKIALNQIIDKQYHLKYLHQNTNIKLLGITFDSQLRNISDYQVLDMTEDGAIVTSNIANVQNQPETKIQVNLTALNTNNNEFFVGREQQLAQIDKAWYDEHTHILSIIGVGGVGKSALVSQWLSNISQQRFAGATKVLGFDFNDIMPDQLDSFINTVRDFFPNDAPWPEAQHLQAQYLANSICQYKSLLIIDQFDALLQLNDDEHLAKVITDTIKLLQFNLDGLCILTSRCKTQQVIGQTLLLEPLTTEQSCQLLANYTDINDVNTLSKLSQAYLNNPLSLQMLGAYVQSVYQGDFSKLTKDEHVQEEPKYGNKIKRLLEQFNQQLKCGPPEDLALLYLIMMCPNNISITSLQTLASQSQDVAGISILQSLSHAKWRFAIERLNQSAWVNLTPNDELHLHPIAKQYFNEQLQLTDAKTHQKLKKVASRA